MPSLFVHVAQKKTYSACQTCPPSRGFFCPELRRQQLGLCRNLPYISLPIVVAPMALASMASLISTHLCHRELYGRGSEGYG
ncbi:uncharacterized protein BT62DRAFT_453986 [Guyanagaster necrorhizus]|uniref:Uncharacterized protein n=1 Tax=Guyanagaster necrorhizus TaxID=856835 RepID=A0A9P8ANP1_9AGAR|nr:uncharacterized protein BT62DRAFT_453986 [Guyanagaster necrorhizus MCA 3950]KAG7442054.1 hypothetical protein BT62DRAFT_453986 [Guyanagaster necrorhizus MCA 3950]